MGTVLARHLREQAVDPEGCGERAWHLEQLLVVAERLSVDLPEGREEGGPRGGGGEVGQGEEGGAAASVGVSSDHCALSLPLGSDAGTVEAAASEAMRRRRIARTRPM